MFTGKNIVVGVTGGIAAYKTCGLVSSLRKLNANVFVVMTQNATEFVTPLTFETLSGNRVVTNSFDRDFPWEVGHISLAKKADIFVIAPATANFIGKYTNGIADDFLTTTIMATKAPVVICPAMNTGMYSSAAVENNMSILTKRGVNFVDSETGHLACGDEGKGRLADIENIIKKIKEILIPVRDLEKKTFLITAGATREELDAVRYITNYSSGKMGLALCEAAYQRGAEVILVAASVSVEIPRYIKTVKVNTAREMYDAVMANYKNADYIIKAAAPADYRPENRAENKIKSKTLELKLVKNPDIAAAVGAVKGDKKLIIFCAETENLEENAKKKLKSKNADMVVANNILTEGAGFNYDTNIVTLITGKGAEMLDKMSKRALADIILDRTKYL